jgi:hypothetical protein
MTGPIAIRGSWKRPKEQVVALIRLCLKNSRLQRFRTASSSRAKLCRQTAPTKGSETKIKSRDELCLGKRERPLLRYDAAGSWNMSDPSDEEVPSSYLFPIPPDEGWFSRLSDRTKKAIRTAEFAGVLAFAGMAYTVGGDMTLAVPALFFAWIIGSIGIATVPGTSGGWKVAAVVGLS